MSKLDFEIKIILKQIKLPKKSMQRKNKLRKLRNRRRNS